MSKSKGKNLKTELNSTKNRNIINAKFSFQYYEKLEKEIGELVTEERLFQYTDEFETRQTLQQR